MKYLIIRADRILDMTYDYLDPKYTAPTNIGTFDSMKEAKEHIKKQVLPFLKEQEADVGRFLTGFYETNELITITFSDDYGANDSMYCFYLFAVK